MDVGLLVVDGEDQGLDARVTVTDAAHRLEPVEFGHADVDDDHIGIHLVNEIEQLLPVAGLRNHIDLVGVLEDEAESPADHGVVIGEDNPNRASDEHALHGYIVGRWGRDLYLG